MSDSNLNIKLIVDANQLNTVMPAAAATVQAATTQMAAHTEAAAGRMGASVTEAKHALHGLGEELGVHVPRFVQTFVAHLGGVGAVLAAAFTPIAVIGLIEVLGSATEKLTKWKELGADTTAKLDEFTSSVIKHRDSLELADIKLGNVLAKLEHKPENRIGEVLAEIKVKTDELGESIAKDIEKMQALLSAGPGAVSALALGTANVHAIGEAIKPMEREYQLAVLGRDVQAQKNILLKEQKLIKDALDKESAVHRVPLSSLQGGVGSNKLVGRDADPEALRTLSAALQAVNAELDKFALLKKEGQKLHEVSDEQALVKLLATSNDLRMKRNELEREEQAFGAQQSLKEGAEKLRDLEMRSAAERQFHDDRVRDAEEEAVAAINLRQMQVQEDLRLGKIGAAEARDRLNKLAADKLAIEKKYIDDRIAEISARLLADDAKTYAQDLALYSKLLHEKQQATERYNAAVEKNTESSTARQQKSWEKLTSELNRTFEGAIRGLMSGTERFGTAFARMFDGVLTSITTFLAKLALKWAEHWILLEIQALAGTQALASIEKAHSLGAIMRAAYKAAAHAYASVPFPLNLAVAPAVFAVVAALGSALPSAAGGMIVPNDTLAMVHKNEMVLPAHISAGLRDMISGGAGSMAFAGAGGGGIHLNYSPTVNAIDARGMEDTLKQHSGAIMKAIQRELRRSNA